MVTFIAQCVSNSYKDLTLYKYVNNTFSLKKTTTIENLKNDINIESSLIFLIPSSLVSSYKNINGSGKNAEAIFLSENEDNVVDNISNVTFKVSNDLGYLINRNIINSINNALSLVRSKVYIYPDYLLYKGDGDLVYLNKDRAIVNHIDGTGTSIDKDYLQEYINIVRADTEFQPKFYTTNDDEIDKSIEFIDLSKLHINFIESHEKNANLFNFKYSLASIISKSNFSMAQVSILMACLLILFIMPSLITGGIKNKTEAYKRETAYLFNEVSNNVNRIVEPRSQIDALLGKQASSKNKIKIPNIDFIYKLGGKYVESINVDFQKNIATIVISEMPSMQLSLINSMGNTFGIKVIDQNLTEGSNTASGTIKISFPNE